MRLADYSRNAVTPQAVRAVGLLMQGYQSPDGSINIPPMPLDAAVHLAGSLQQESYLGLDTNAMGDANTAHGLAGWHNQAPDYRWSNVQRFQQTYFPNDVFAGQVLASANELRTQYPGVYATITDPNVSSAQKAYALGKIYEGAGIVAADARQLNADQLKTAIQRNPDLIQSAGVQTVTPANAQDAMVPSSGPLAVAAEAGISPDRYAADATPTGQLAEPTTADTTASFTPSPLPSAPPSAIPGAQQLVNGIINNDPAAIQAGSQAMAAAGKAAPDRAAFRAATEKYFQGLPVDVSAAAKDTYQTNAKDVIGRVDAGIKALGAASTDFSNVPIFGGLITNIATGIGDPLIKQGVADANAGLNKWIGPDSAQYSSQAAIDRASSPENTANIYSGLDANVTGPGIPDRSLGVAPSPNAFSAGLAPGPAPAASGGPDFSNFSMGGIAPASTPQSTITPSPVNTTWGGSPIGDPLTTALTQANPAASLIPGTGDATSAGLANALAGETFMTSPPVQQPSVMPAAPVPRQNNPVTNVNYTPNGAPPPSRAPISAWGGGGPYAGRPSGNGYNAFGGGSDIGPAGGGVTGLGGGGFFVGGPASYSPGQFSMNNFQSPFSPGYGAY